MNSGRQIRIGAVLSYIQIILNVGINLVFTPLIIHILGKSEYGLFNTVSSVVSTLSILSLGFGSSYIRYFSRYREDNDTLSIGKLNGLFIFVYSIMGMVALLFGLFLSNHLDIVFSEGLTSEELSTAKVLMLLLTVNLSVSFPASVFSSIITAHEEFIFQKIVLIFRQIASPLLSIIVLLFGYRSVGLVVSMLTISIICDVINYLFINKRLRCKFYFGGFDRDLLKSIAVFSGFIAINMIVDQVNTNLDKVILGRYCGTVHVAVYAVGFTLYNYYHVFSTAISNVFAPKTHRIWNDSDLSITEKDRQLSEMFANVGRVQLLVLWLVATGLCLFGRSFIHLWVGDGYDNAYFVAIILALSSIVPLTQNVGIEIQRAKNKHKFRAILYGIMAGVNLVMSIFLCQKYQEIGCVIGTAIANIVSNTILMDFYYSRQLNIKISMYWKNFIRIIAAAFPAFICCMVVVSQLRLDTFPKLIGAILGYSILYVLMEYAFVVSNSEKMMIQQKVRRILLKISIH